MPRRRSAGSRRAASAASSQLLHAADPDLFGSLAEKFADARQFSTSITIPKG